MSAAENLDRSERLAWTRREDDKGFRSEPDGAGHPDRYAEIWFVPMPYAEGMNWAWSVHWGRARRAGHARSSQEAADHCNRVWPAVATEGLGLAAAHRDADLLMARIDEVARSGFVDVESFGLGNMDGKLLLQLVRHCREHWEGAFKDGRPLAGVEMLMGAASSELHQRRLDGRPALWSDGRFGQFQPPGQKN